MNLQKAVVDLAKMKMKIGSGDVRYVLSRACPQAHTSLVYRKEMERTKNKNTDSIQFSYHPFRLNITPSSQLRQWYQVLFPSILSVL